MRTSLTKLQSQIAVLSRPSSWTSRRYCIKTMMTVLKLKLSLKISVLQKNDVVVLLLTLVSGKMLAFCNIDIYQTASKTRLSHPAS